MNIQAMIDAMWEADRDTRGDYHLTLGKAIKVLEGVPPETIVRFGGEFDGDGEYPGEEDSYRGFYNDLAIEPSSEPCTAGQLLDRLRKALNATYMGYKGGDFVMDERTPLWRAEYSCCGEAIIAADHRDDALYLICKEREGVTDEG